MKRNKRIRTVRPLGYTPKSHRKCLRSLKYSYFNVSRPHSNKNPNLIRHNINLIFYPNFILNYHYSDQILKKENRWSLVFSKTSAIHFGCGRRTYADLPRKSAVLRLPSQSAWPARYSRLHWNLSLHARAFSGSSPLILFAALKKQSAKRQTAYFMVAGEGLEPTTSGLWARQ